MGDDTIRCGDPIDCNKLAEAWAGAASVDRAHVLMCLAGWARAGAFDEGAFVLNWGGPLSTEAAAQSLRRLAVAPDLTTLKLEEGTSPSNFDWPFLRLEALGRFCISRSIRPPPGLFTKEDPTAVHASSPRRRPKYYFLVYPSIRRAIAQSSRSPPLRPGRPRRAGGARCGVSGVAERCDRANGLVSAEVVGTRARQLTPHVSVPEARYPFCPASMRRSSLFSRGASGQVHAVSCAQEG